MTKYQEIADQLRQRIAAGDEWQEGDQLPGISDLEAEFGVAMHTIMRAERILRDEGILRIAQGQGAFVARVPEPMPAVDPFDLLATAQGALNQLAELLRSERKR